MMDLNTITDGDWNNLLRNVKLGNCTPFLGAGVNCGLLPLGKEIAKIWADSEEYPLEDTSDLARVAQYLALTGASKAYPKELIQDLVVDKVGAILRDKQTTDSFNSTSHPLGILARLPLPVYLTTNYDDLMFRALKYRGKNSKLELCAWNEALEGDSAAKNPEQIRYDDPPHRDREFGPSEFLAGYKSTDKEPVVYHLHGHYEKIESMVLTENDYLDFLVNMSKMRSQEKSLLPARIQRALAGSSLIFIGYSLADFNFRVLFRGLIRPLPESTRLNISIQLVPGDLSQPTIQKAVRYLTKFFEDMKVKVFWGTAEQFTQVLWSRWTKLSDGGNPP